MPKIQVKDLSKSYIWGEEHISVLKGVSLDVQKSSFVSIVGESGCGKTTLLNLMGGLDFPDKGSVLIDGKDILEFSEEELSHFRNKKMGFIFQFYNLLQDFTVLENVMIPYQLLSGSKKKAKAKAEELLATLNMEHRLNYYPSRLSGGEQQRVAIARALMNEPEIIFADEPTGNLDKDNREMVMSLLKKMQDEQGFTLIMVTHDHQIASLADSCIRLNYGVIANS